MDDSASLGFDAVFLSDLHLTEPEERNGKTLLRFFHSLAARNDLNGFHLFLLGDIFDLWVSDHVVFRRRWRDLLEAIATMRTKGAKVIYFEGNHDMHLAPYWADVLGADVRTNAALFDVAGWRIRCEHGDEINRNDHSYLRLRAFLRSRPLRFLAHNLSGKFWDGFGQRWSRQSRKYSSAERQNHAEKMVALVRDHAARVWEDDPFDLIVTGHVHVRDDWTFEKGGRRVRSINLGSWFEERKVLCLSKDRLEWRDL